MQGPKDIKFLKHCSTTLKFSIDISVENINSAFTGKMIWSMDLNQN